MRKVLVVITALMLAAIVIVPAMGYTISPQGKTNYTINSEKVNYTIGSGTPAHEMVYSKETAEHYPTYSITSTPMTYSFKLGATGKYSMKSGINATKIEVLGGYKSSALGTSEMVGKGLIIPTEPENATEQAIGHPAPAAKPVAPNVIDLTKGAGNMTKTNATANVTAPAPAAVKNATASVTAPAPAAVKNATANVTAPAPAAVKNATANVTAPAPAAVKNATANVTAPAPAAVKLSIKGMVKDENQTGLAGWKIELATSKKMFIADTNTSANGSYSFSELNPGTYIVTEVLPAGWTAVTEGHNEFGITLKDKDETQDFVNKMTQLAHAIPAGNKTNTTAPK